MNLVVERDAGRLSQPCSDADAVCEAIRRFAGGDRPLIGSDATWYVEPDAEG